MPKSLTASWLGLRTLAIITARDVRRVVSGVLVAVVAFAGTAAAQQRVDYLKDIKPLLREKCFACHAALKQKAKLRLDTALLAKAGGRSGPAVQPGAPTGACSSSA